MARTDPGFTEESQALMAGYAFKLVAGGYDPIQVQRALAEFATYVEFLKDELVQTEFQLEDARSKNQSVRRNGYAEFGVKMAAIIEAARQQAVQVIDEASRQAQVLRIRDEAEREWRKRVAEAEGAAVQARIDAERALRAGEDRPLREIQAATADSPAPRGRLVPAKGVDPDAHAGTVGAGAHVEYKPFDIEGNRVVPAATNGGNGHTTEFVKLEDFDERWLDELWRTA